MTAYTDNRYLSVLEGMIASVTYAQTVALHCQKMNEQRFVTMKRNATVLQREGLLA